jgi:hypothetical protein
MALVVLFAACGDEGPPPAPVAFADLADCDVTTAPCQQGIYESVAARLEAGQYAVPRIRTISVEQHEREVRNGLDLEDLTGEDPATRGLRLFGFIPEATDSLAAAQADYFITQVAAYYSRGSRSITVIDRDYEPGVAQLILAHEFVHAIQDSEFNLSTVSSGANTEDGVIGVRSVIEGDAVHQSFAWYSEVTETPLTPSDWVEIYSESTERLRARVADTSVALIDTASSFPYSFGFRLMTDTTLAGGLPARATAFGAPPPTTAQVLAGYGEPTAVLDTPDAAHPAPTMDAVVRDANRYGAWYVYGYLVREGVADDEAWETALAWTGDELAIYQEGEEVVAVWRVRFDDLEAAGIFRDRINEMASPNVRQAVALDDDVLVFAAESEPVLLAWLEQPLDEMTAAVVLKDVGGGAVSAGGCTLVRDPTLIDPRTVVGRR